MGTRQEGMKIINNNGYCFFDLFLQNDTDMVKSLHLCSRTSVVPHPCCNNRRWDPLSSWREKFYALLKSVIKGILSMITISLDFLFNKWLWTPPPSPLSTDQERGYWIIAWNNKFLSNFKEALTNTAMCF